jgi:hypothetical protein
MHMLAQVTDSGSNNITMANEMHSQFLLHEESQLELETLPASSSTPIHIDLPEDDEVPPEEVETDHDSAGEECLAAAPDYDEDTEDQKDDHDPTMEFEPGTSNSNVSNAYHTSSSRKKANLLNKLISKVMCCVSFSSITLTVIFYIKADFNLDPG